MWLKDNFAFSTNQNKASIVDQSNQSLYRRPIANITTIWIDIVKGYTVELP